MTPLEPDDAFLVQRGQDLYRCTASEIQELTQGLLLRKIEELESEIAVLKSQALQS